MRKPLMITLCLSLLCTSAFAQTTVETQPEQILVVGKRPGPGLWKVSKGEHVLWIFGTHSPLPRKMAWRSQQVETVLAQSQESISPPGIGVGVGFMQSFNIITALPFAIGVKNNPDGARLQDVVPADVYARWTVLKNKYLGDDSGIERERPIFAATTLFAKAIAQAGLGKDDEVLAAIKKMSTKNNLKITSTTITVPVDDPRGALRDFKKSSVDDLDCFSKTIDRLEVDLDAMRARANAWAIGDIEKMRALTYPDQVSACKSAMFNSPVMKALPGAASLEQRMRDTWLAAAEKALADNASTFALLPVSQILNAAGLVAALRAKGYVVEQPD